MQAKKPYISTGLRHIFAIVSSQISTMMEPVNAILKHEPANRRLKISPRDKSFLSSLSIIHGLPHFLTHGAPLRVLRARELRYKFVNESFAFSPG